MKKLLLLTAVTILTFSVFTCCDDSTTDNIISSSEDDSAIAPATARVYSINTIEDDSAKTETAQEHLAFMGIPIDGKLSDFVEKIEKKGFSVLNTWTDSVKMIGKFASKDNITILCKATPKSKTIYKIIAYTPQVTSWSLLWKNYEHYSKLLQKKYKSPDTKKVEFYSYVSDDYDRIYAVRNGKLNCFSEWNLPLGKIKISIEKERTVRIAYTDKINKELIGIENGEDI